jgi:hypothetical protein
MPCRQQRQAGGHANSIYPADPSVLRKQAWVVHNQIAFQVIESRNASRDRNQIALSKNPKD